MFVASVAGRLGVIHFMAVQADIHGRDTGDFRNSVHLPNLPMTRLALHACFQVWPVTPRHPRQHGVNAHPGNGLF
jgi:hypothetical protein